MPQNARPIRRSQGKDYTRLAPVLKTLDVTNARQLRHAIAAPYDPRVEGANLGTRPEFHHHLGGPCVLNALLAKSGRHIPRSQRRRCATWPRRRGDDVDADVEDMHPAASIAVYASTLAEETRHLRGAQGRSRARHRGAPSKSNSPRRTRSADSRSPDPTAPSPTRRACPSPSALTSGNSRRSS